MNRFVSAKALFSLIAALALLVAVHCAKKEKILVDGSSTVYPITEAVAEEYGKANTNVNVTVGVAGTGGGFKKFCNGETDISDASRPIKTTEAEKCAEAGISQVELAIAYDGLAIIVHKSNDFVKELTVAQLKSIFQTDKPAKTWKDVNPAWPAEAIKVYSPGQDSGTFDYFVEAILGADAKVRPDAAFSEDDNVLVTGVAGDKNSIGFFGLAYYEENQDKLKLVPIVNPKSNKAVAPTLETVKSGEYAPLSRPLFIYVSNKAKARKAVADFVNFYLDNAAKLTADVGYIPLPDAVYADQKTKFAAFQ